jgi:hypothetical protein
MLQKNDLAEHYESMQNERKRLRELCTEYHATGPTARLLNQRGGSKNSPRQLMNIVSGRWSPFHDPSSPPTQGGSSPREHVRLKLGRRPKCFTEVLSFDGSILRYFQNKLDNNMGHVTLLITLLLYLYFCRWLIDDHVMDFL